jgi:RHS repeat-associated protein
MNGAGVVQSASLIGFETLYAGYRWDSATPQMYYVRNRFLLPVIGTWSKRDPLGYVDGIGLYEYCYSNVIVWNDASGLQGTTAPRPAHTK